MIKYFSCYIANNLLLCANFIPMASSEENFNATITNLLSSIPSNIEENLRVFTEVFAQGPKKPIITNNPNDPKLKAYKDSLSLFKYGEALDNAYQKMGYDIYGATPYKNAQSMTNLKGKKDYSNDKILPTHLGYLHDKLNKDGKRPQIGLVPYYAEPVQPIKYQDTQKQPSNPVQVIQTQPTPPTPILKGEIVETPTNTQAINNPLFQLETATKILDQLKEGDYSVTFGDPTKTASQKTKTFANKAAFEAFISAMEEENNSPVTLTRFKNGASALFTRESTKDKPIGM